MALNLARFLRVVGQNVQYRDIHSDNVPKYRLLHRCHREDNRQF
ncbi:Uncharacterised protein [Vibrio cholerae]|nr:Uncharacterised protein [Vibrio cholerae]CSI61628.1 Uncharacterised protein [Vibrio cholerae]CSI66128.1 Uncharacterised protein [Vibrio cholerae]